MRFDRDQWSGLRQASSRADGQVTPTIFYTLKQSLIEECNLHTVVLLPNGVFAPYTLHDRNSYLLQLGITPIWFPASEFDFVEGILRLARNELRYRQN